MTPTAPGSGAARSAEQAAPPPGALGLTPRKQRTDKKEGVFVNVPSRQGNGRTTPAMASPPADRSARRSPRSPAPRASAGRRALLLLGALLVLGAPLAPAPAAGATPEEGIHKIQHVVMIMQENRSFDTYFGTYPGADGIPAGVCVPDPVNGGCVRPYHDNEDHNTGGPHEAANTIADVDGGKMDGYVATAEKGLECTTTDPNCSGCKLQNSCVDVMGYHDAREIPNYWTYAQNYVLQDNMFASSSSWSLPEHLYLVSAWSALCNEELSPLQAPLSCTSSLKPVKPAASPGAPLVPGRTTYEWTDLTYLLAKAGVSWRYYIFEGAEPDCERDEAITCEAVAQNPQTPGIWNPLPDFADVKSDGQVENVQSLNNFYTAVHQTESCGLPNVTWIDPNAEVSEHPPASVQRGQAYVTTLVNAIMRSPCWQSTAIFLSWDDWGGFYDHVRPPAIDQGGYGLRVPGLVISPYAKTGYIDHQQLSHDAYLKFIEDDFLGAARLNPNTDGRPDSRPNVREEATGLGNLAEDFDFSQSPRPPLLLPVHPAPGPASTPPGGGTAAPTVSVGTAGSRTQTTATLTGTVNPNGSELSQCRFEYGITSYAASAPCAQSTSGMTGSSAVAVSAAVGGLAANTIYHVRLAATNAGGTGTNVGSFQTLPWPPTVSEMSPVSGPAAGGTPVTIIGTNFLPGKTTVKFGLNYATAVECPSTTLCYAAAPPHAAGAVNVRVGVAGQLSATTAASVFTYF
jgi:phospholipase C